jgi:hypothetical protein
MRIRLSALLVFGLFLVPIGGCGDQKADTKGADPTGKTIGQPKQPEKPPEIPLPPKGS